MESGVLSLAGVGLVVISEGIKFLYGQASDLLKRRREKKDDAEKSARAESVEVVLPPNIFAGQFAQPAIHYDVLDRVQAEMNELRKELLDYTDGTAVLTDHDSDVILKVDALRQLVEAVYQQRLTFVGENRPASGPVVDGSIDVGTVLGNAAAVRIKSLKGGTIRATATADVVAPGGVLTGAEIETVE